MIVCIIFYSFVSENITKPFLDPLSIHLNKIPINTALLNRILFYIKTRIYGCSEFEFTRIANESHRRRFLSSTLQHTTFHDVWRTPAGVPGENGGRGLGRGSLNKTNGHNSSSGGVKVG